MKKLILFSGLFSCIFGFGQAGHAAPQTSVDLMCKQQAKDMAVQIYTSCVEENQKAQLEQMEQLRAEYKSELENIKKKFEAKLQAVKSGEKKASKLKETSAKSAPMSAKGKSAKALRKGALPEKAVSSTETIAVDMTPATEAVVAAPDSTTEVSSSAIYESESSDTEVVDLPLPNE